LLLILPCGGESTRFPGVRPKWLLTQPNGNLMVCDAITKLDLTSVKKIVLIAKKKQLEGNESSLRRAFEKSGCDKPVEFFSLSEKTRSQPETIAKYLEHLNEDIPIFIKDCDGQFDCQINPQNEVILGNIGLLTGECAVAKSYCKINDLGRITAIVEKQVISQHFCVGGYSFFSSKEFLSSYDKIKHHENLYVSHVIEFMMMNGSSFAGKFCKSYEDWGTLTDWQNYKKTFATIFLDIDGVLFKNSSEFFSPKWGESPGISANIETIKKLVSSGRFQLVLTTARTKEHSKITEKQLQEAGIFYHQILYGMLHSQRIIVNDYSRTNPYKCCDALNIRRDADELGELLNDIIGVSK